MPFLLALQEKANCHSELDLKPLGDGESCGEMGDDR